MCEKPRNLDDANLDLCLQLEQQSIIRSHEYYVQKYTFICRFLPLPSDRFCVVSEKTLESPLDCKEIRPVHPKEINPEYALEGLMLKLKLQYFDHLMQRTDSLEKTLMLGKIQVVRRMG